MYKNIPESLVALLKGLRAGVLLTLLWALPVVAEEHFQSSLHVRGERLLLNGIGTRTATIFSLRVYDAALYLVTRSDDGEAILRSPEVKQLRMRFHRDVGREKLTDAFSEGVKKNSPNAPSLAAPLKEFLALIPDAREGDEFVIEFLADRIIFQSSASAPPGEVVSSAFPTALLAVWLGSSPPSEELKRGLLGR